MANMGNNLRRWLACILPCGFLDIIRVVHINGQVEEYGRPVSAGEILAANPGHVLSLPCSQGDVVRRVLIVSPESKLKRGHIYFLIPKSPPIQEQDNKKKDSRKAEDSAASAATAEIAAAAATVTKKKYSMHRRCRSVPVAVWRPHLEQISEDPLRSSYPMQEMESDGGRSSA